MTISLTVFETLLLSKAPLYLMRMTDDALVDITAIKVVPPIVNKDSSTPGTPLVSADGIFAKNSRRFSGNAAATYVTLNLPNSVKSNTATVMIIMNRIRNLPGTTGATLSWTNVFSSRSTTNGIIMYANAGGTISVQVCIGGTLRTISGLNVNDISTTGSIVHIRFDGRYANVYCDGVLKGSYDNGTTSTITYPTNYITMIGCGISSSNAPDTSGNYADCDIGYFGIYSTLADDDIAAQVTAFNAYKKLSGTAVLNNGSAASSVVISEWSGTRMVAVVPASSGAWSAYVPAGSYLVTGIGPGGYQPVSHGPVLAVAP